MATDRELKVGLMAGLLVALVVYHLSGTLVSPVNIYYDIFKIIQLTISIVLYFLVVYNAFLAKLVFRKNYIAGEYAGHSREYIRAKNGNLITNEINKYFEVEKFEIQQNLFETTISGHTFQGDTDILVSTWSGRLIKVDGNIYYFGLELSYDRGEFGTLKLTFNTDEVVGFYFSGNPQTKHVQSIIAKKVNSKKVI